MSGSAPRSAGVLLGFLAATSLFLTGCNNKDSSDSASSGPLVVGKDLLSAEVQAQLTKKQGKQSSPVNCPNDLDATEGATTTCLLKAPDGVYNVSVTVTQLDWNGFGNYGVGNAIFDAVVADKPNP